MWLNVTQVSVTVRQLRAATPAHRLSQDELLWLYCPNCLWVMIGSKHYHEQQWPCCPRSGTSEPNTYGGASAYFCPSDIVPRAFSAELEGALWTSLNLAGTNAVAQLLAGVRPEHVGLPSAVQCLHMRRRGERSY